MNTDKLAGEGRDVGGKVKETVGNVTGDSRLQSEGLADQAAGKVQKGYGAATDAIAPLADKARAFARERPYATAALLGAIGVAVLNTLRGKR